ncbi:MAG: VCBS repeat-containing protein, partial [Saprospiraceae bacterium]
MRHARPIATTFSILLALAALSNCNKKEAAGTAQFQLLRKADTGLDFENLLKPSLQFNALTYMYFYNGGGIAAGDFNNDGQIDLYFTSNMGENKMFLNQGGLKFKDITAQAGIAGHTSDDTGGEVWWNTGASVVDINNDGLLDIYVSQVGNFLNIKGRNQLFVCQDIHNGIPSYADEAIPYGLDLVGFGTQAAFFDYDLDGDLDMYQLNHSVHANGTFGQKKTFEGTQHLLAGDKLMENQGGKFVDVTVKSGIKSTVIGYGLGIVTGDVNNDGRPEIYIGNDFHEDDYLYINTLPVGEGRSRAFKDVRTDAIQHTSKFSMGVDMADVNNDAWSEIFSLDMLPEDPKILKSSLGDDEYGVYQFKLGYGYGIQYARNTLQKNNGDAVASGQSPTFSEVGMFAGVHATDWSWATLFLDFDNDGDKDLFVANGIERRMNDIDYANSRMENEDLRIKQANSFLEEEDMAAIEKMPEIKIPNKFFGNRGRFNFEDLAKQIKGNVPSFSNGSICADLDNDGDLDLVSNNLEDEPFLYQNLETENKTPNRDYLSLHLKGPPANRFAVGARAVVFKKNGEKISGENFPVRGYQSSAVTPLHLGIGDRALVDSVVLIWPDQSCQRLSDLKFNSRQNLVWQPGLPVFDFSLLRQKAVSPYPFNDISKKSGLSFEHLENPFVEFNRESLIPHMVSAEGPALAVGDANGDGLEDVFFGSSKKVKSALYFQKPDGTFFQKTPAAILQDSVFEDVDAVFADLENDGDLDLVVAAGGNEWRGTDEAMKQRAYLNDGKGNFQRMDFPGLYMTAACVLPCDFNNDGLVDFFFGARALPWNHGLTPSSALMLNKGNGQFEDVAEKIGGGMQQAGMVKNGAWADMDGDGDDDLLLAIEWEPLTVFLNNLTPSPNGEGRGVAFQKTPINDLSGWWNFALPHDFDGDGDLDILAGNLGQNSKLKPTREQPVRMHISDFDNNGQVEPILTYFVKGQEIPFSNHAEIMKQLPSLKKKFLYAKDFAKASVPEIFGKDKLAKSVLREANTFSSMYFENTGGLNFKAHPLPDELQFSTLNAYALADLDGDGKNEIVLGGNFYEC